jgi:hypothetical protein
MSIGGSMDVFFLRVRERDREREREGDVVISIIVL